MRRVGVVAVTPLVRFVEWLFGPGVPGFSLYMGFWALVWGSLMVIQPETFDSGRFAGMRWMPDAGWIGFFCVLALMHSAAAFRWFRPSLRILADLMSAWIWLSIAVSFLRVEIRTETFTPGTWIYVATGFAALAHGIYCAGIPRDGG